MKKVKDEPEQVPVNKTEEPTSEPAAAPAEQLNEEEVLQAASQKLIELTNDLQRTRADFENYRKQTEAQRLQAMATAKAATVKQFLPLLDDFERALTVYAEQLAPLSKSFEKTLAELKLTKIETTPGTEFNPDYHEAVSVEDGEGEVEVIAETLRPGYLYEGTVIRPAMVKVTRQ